VKKRHLICAFCGREGRASTEHAIAKWVGTAAANHVGVTPVMKRHKWGGAATVRDVCVHCNNTVLSRLDKAAKVLVERVFKGPLTLTAEEAMILAQWSGKVAYNMQLLCFERACKVRNHRFRRVQSAGSWAKAHQLRFALRPAGTDVGVGAGKLWCIRFKQDVLT
jgi:hypothetical protein